MARSQFGLRYRRQVVVGGLREKMSDYQERKQVWAQPLNDKYGGYKTVGLAVLIRKAIEKNGQ